MDFLYNLSRNFVPNFHERKKRKMKHRVLSILLALTFLVSVCLFCTSALAATGAQDGVTAELTTDKAEYAAGESINVTLLVTNTNVRVNNLRTELVLPAGVTLTTGALVNEGATMAPGTEAKFEYGLTVDAAEVPTTTPGGDNDGPAETGDYSMIIFGMLAVASLVGLIALTGMKNIFKQRWFVLVLCGALLLGVVGPVAATAAATKKTFEVTETVTLAGVAAEIKAIVSYDLNDEIVHTEEVAFKKDGQFLWNVNKEQGYYLPSDISWEGKNTSKDGAYRPEVNAPYIDMLFGTSKKAGEFKTNIFNADAEQTVLIGKTDDPASAAALEMIGKDEWIITVIDGKLVATGWYDNASAAAARALYALGTADATDITLSLPMIGKMNYVAAEIPAVSAGTYANGVDSDQGSVMFRWVDVTAADFETYTKTLEAAGYTLYQENTLDGYGDSLCLFATYVKGDAAVHVQYLPNSLNAATEAEVAGFTSAELKAYQASFRAAATELRVVVESTDNLFPIDDPAKLDLSHVGGVAQPEQLHVVNLYTGYSDGNDVGACMIYTLADGSFFVWDGGYGADAEQVYRTLKYLNKRDDGIVVAGWVLTHGHNDHVGFFSALASTEWAKEITIEKMIVNVPANAYSWRGFNDPYGYAYGCDATMYQIAELTAKFAQGDNFQIVVPHMGQVMQIRNLNIESLTVGDEDVFPVIINNDNAWSHVAKITFDGIDQVVMMMADSALDQTYNIFFPLMLDELDADILQTVHHGLGGNTSRLYPIFNRNPRAEKVAIWNTSYKSIKDNNYTYNVKSGMSPEEAAKGAYLAPGQSPDNMNRLWTDMNKALRPENGGKVEEDIVADEYVTTLNFPYAPGESQKIYIGAYKSDFFDSEKVKLAVLPTFRFGNKIEEYLEKFEAYVRADDPDVLALTVFDWMANAYNGKDVDTIKLMAENLGYAFTYYSPAWACDKDGNLTTGEGTIGQLILSRYPITSAETIVLNEGTAGDAANEGRSAGHVVLDMDGLLVDVYATHFHNADTWIKFAEQFKPQGDYWFILGNTKVSNAATISNNLGSIEVQQAVSGQQLNILASSGAILSDELFDATIASTVGCRNFDQYVRVTAVLGRKVLCDDMVIGEFDDIPTVGQWWVNYLNQAENREQVARWLLKSKHEVVGMVHIPNELLDDEFAADFAALVGYPYYHVVKIPNANGAGGSYGHMILSAYPLEAKKDIIIRSEADASASPNKPAESYGHVVIDMTGTELNTKVDFIFGDMDANNNNGLERDNQRIALEAAIKEITDASGLPFVLLSGYDNGHIKNLETYAGKEFNHQTHPWSNCIVASAPLPMSGREFFGTTAFPENGESPIKITIPNVDPYVKADLAKIPEHQVTVENGLGDGVYQMDKVVSITADKAPYGKVFDKWVVVEGNVTLADATAAKTTFVMGNTPVTVKATYKDVPVEVKTPTGQTTSLKVAVEPTFRYSRKWNQEGAKDMILNHYRTIDADVLALTLIDKNVVSYNGADVVGIVCAELADLYPYTYYAPGNVVGNGSLETGESTYGHLILSKYPVVYTENIFLTDNGGAAEDRTVNHAVIKLDDNTLVDIYATHMGTASSEWPILAANFNQQGDYFLILGNTKIRGSGSTADSYLGTTGTTAGCGNDIAILASKGMTFEGQCVTDNSVSSVLPPNMDPMHVATITVPLLSDAVTKYVVNVDGVAQGYFAAGEEVTLTAPNPGVGKRFQNWILPEGFTLTEGTVNDKTIKFTMPAGILNLETENSDVSSFFVYVNGTQVGEYEPGQTVKLTAPNAERGKVFGGWKGLEGVETINNATAKQMTISFKMPNRDLELTSTYKEINTSAEFPTLNAIGTDKQPFMVTYSWGSRTTELAITSLTASLQNGYNVAVYLNTGMTEQDVAAIAAATGYDYYMWTAAKHFLLSEYPFVHNDTFQYESGGTRTFTYVTLDVDGTLVDLYFGENSGGNGAAQNNEIVVPWMKHHTAESNNPYFLITYSATDASMFTGMYKDYDPTNKAVNYDGWINILRSEGTEYVGCEPMQTPATNRFVMHSSFNVAKNTNLDVTSWWMVYSRDGYRQKAIDMYKKLNTDVVVMSNVDIALGTGHIVTEAAAYGYVYGSFVEFTDGGTSGTLLLSKYPIKEVDKFIVAGRYYKHVQIIYAGQTIDFYYGGNDDGNSWDASALATKIKDNYNATKNPFIAAIKGSHAAFSNAMGGAASFTDKDGNSVAMQKAFYGTSDFVYVCAPLTTADQWIEPANYGFPSNHAGMADGMSWAAVVLP